MAVMHQTLPLLRERLHSLEKRQRHAVGGCRFQVRAALDALVPEVGWRRASLTEWLSPGEGSGAGTLGMVVAAGACREGGVLVVVDRRGEFCPPGAVRWGIDLERTIVVRPRSVRDEVWVWQEALRSKAVAAVWGWVGALDERQERQLQLAAEAGRAVGIMMRPARVRERPSWADLRLLVEVQPAHETVRRDSADRCFAEVYRRCRVEVLRCRGGGSVIGKAVVLELDDEAGDVRLAAELADPAAHARQAGA